MSQVIFMYWVKLYLKTILDTELLFHSVQVALRNYERILKQTKALFLTRSIILSSFFRLSALIN